MEVLSSYIVLFYMQKSSVEIDEDSFILLKKKKNNQKRLLNKEWEMYCIHSTFSKFNLSTHYLEDLLKLLIKT